MHPSLGQMNPQKGLLGISPNLRASHQQTKRLGGPGPPMVPLSCPCLRRPEKAEAGADHLHPEPAGGAGGPVCQDSVPGCVRARGSGSEDQSARVQGSGGVLCALGPFQPFLRPRVKGGRVIVTLAPGPLHTLFLLPGRLIPHRLAQVFVYRPIRSPCPSARPRGTLAFKVTMSPDTPAPRPPPPAPLGLLKCCSPRKILCSVLPVDL